MTLLHGLSNTAQAHREKLLPNPKTRLKNPFYDVARSMPMSFEMKPGAVGAKSL
jgi:hypothetical protein